jgi:hypothetical protein
MEQAAPFGMTCSVQNVKSFIRMNDKRNSTHQELHRVSWRLPVGAGWETKNIKDTDVNTGNKATTDLISPVKAPFASKWQFCAATLMSDLIASFSGMR